MYHIACFDYNDKRVINVLTESNVEVGEVGELSEIFQWKGEVEKGLENWEESEKEHLGEELSDVLLYLIRLADICGIDLAHAVLNKIHKNPSNTLYPLIPLSAPKKINNHQT